MLISPALAFNSTTGTGSSGGAIAVSIIIGLAITYLLIYVAQRKWRRRKQLRRKQLRRDGSGE